MFLSRSLFFLLMLSQLSPALSQQKFPEVIDTAWQSDPDKIRHLVKKLQIVAKPATRSTIGPGGIFRCAWNKPLELPVLGFNAGDTLEIKLSSPGKHRFRSVVVRNAEKQQLAGITNASEANFRLVAQNETALTLKLETRPTLKKQFTEISVSRISPVPSDSFYVVQDTTFSLKRTVISDTLLTSVLDDTLTLSPVWNIESKPVCFKKCVIPLPAEPDTRLSHISYWIGIGQNCLTQYARLEASVPANWSRPGVSAPVGAYTMGHLISLPVTQNHEVEWLFLKDNDKIKSENSRKFPVSLFPDCQQAQNCTLRFSRSRTARLGDSTIPVSEEQLGFVISFRNKNTVVGYPIRIIMIGCFVRETPGEMVRSILQIKSYKEEIHR
ncbi:MAG: hypothetical protein RLZ62_1076 [Bacteroidota bacterium]|jgi:hypothetical protein